MIILLFFHRHRHPRGFTLLEMMIVLLIIGVLVAIAIPTWNEFLNNYRLNTSMNEILVGMRQTQVQAINTRKDWRFSIREAGGIVQWSSHPDSIPPQLWSSLDRTIAIDSTRTTLPQTSSIHRVEFGFQGQVNGQLGRVTLRIQNGGAPRRCVVVSTLLGVLRTATNEHCN